MAGAARAPGFLHAPPDGHGVPDAAAASDENGDVVTILELVAIGAGLVGAAVLVVYFIGR